MRFTSSFYVTLFFFVSLMPASLVHPQVGESLLLGNDSGVPAYIAKAAVKSSKNELSKVEVKGAAKFTTLNLSTTKKVKRVRTKELSNPKRIVFDLFDVTLAKGHPKVLQNTSLGRIRLGSHADKTRVVIDVDGERIPSYRVNSSQGGVIVEFLDLSQLAKTPNNGIKQKAPIRGAPPAPDLGVEKQDHLVEMLEPESDRISIELKDADIRNVLGFISDVGGVNIVAGEEVKGTVSIRLKDVRWKEALATILQIQDLGFDEKDGIIRVLPLSHLGKAQELSLVKDEVDGNPHP